MKRIIALGTVGLMLLSSCGSTVPITGRKRIFDPVSDSQVLPTSFSQYKEFLRDNKLSNDKVATAQIKNIGARISKAVDKYLRDIDRAEEANSYRWEFNLIEDQQLNAWCMPGGKVVFYTGILPVAANEDGIAAIMGHEVAHAFAKHGQERMASQARINQLGQVIGAVTADKSAKSQQLWNQAFGLTSTLGTLKYSRTHETEADKLGLVFMLMAGYDGEEAVKVWERMRELSGGSASPEFLSTHPSNASRINTIKSFLPEARQIAAQHK